MKLPTRLPAFLFVAAVLALVSAAIFPVSYTHHRQFPADDSKYIRRVWGQESVGQTFASRHPVESIRLFLRSPQSASLELTNEEGKTIARFTVGPAAADQWVTIPLRERLTPGTHSLTLHAPEQTSQEAAVLVRFQIDSNAYPDGTMFVNGKPSYGDIALQLVENKPAGSLLKQWLLAHPGETKGFSQAVTLAVALAMIVAQLPQTQRSWRISLALLATAAIFIRLPLLFSIDGVYGGDAYNYLFKAVAWIGGSDPLAADPRKGPFLPLLLIPTLATNDPIFWSRAIGVVAAAAAATLTAALLRRLKFTPPLALLGGLLLAVNRDMWWESVNGLANVPYTALILAAVLAYEAGGLHSVGMLGSLAALTRYEGAAVLAILAPAAWLKHHFSWPAARRLLVPIVIILSLPFIMYAVTGQWGVRTASDITSDAGLYVAWDWGDFQTNLKAVKNIVKHVWLIPDNRVERALTSVFAAAGIIGLAALLKRRLSFAIPALLLVLLHVGVVAALLPKDRYLIPIIPFFAIAIAAAASLLPRRAGIFTLALLAALTLQDARRHVPSLRDEYNERATADAMLTRAAQSLQNSSGNVSAVSDFLPIRLAVTDNRFKLYDPAQPPADWVDSQNIEYLIDVTTYPTLTILTEHPEWFEQINVFKPEQGSVTARVFRVIK